MRTFFKVLLIGILSAAFRLCEQMLIPGGTQTALQPSAFALNGTLPFVFSLYAMAAYSVIAAMFLLIRDGMSGNKIIKGLKYGFICASVWVAYLLEPLPHSTALVLSYPIADGIALLWLGALAGLFLGQNASVERKPLKILKAVTSAAAVAALFMAGRLFQYLVLHIYSSFDANTSGTILWGVFTGLVIGAALLWLNQYTDGKNRIHRSIVLGLLLFGVNLLFFNFFVPLALDVDIPDLITRTAVDLIFVTIGTLFITEKRKTPRPFAIGRGAGFSDTI